MVNKDKFLYQLKVNLDKKNIYKEVKDDIIKDFSEHIDFSIQSGKSEEEATSVLGDPSEIAKDFDMVNKVEKIIKNPNTINALGLVGKFFKKSLLGFLVALGFSFVEMFLLLFTIVGVMFGFAGAICVIGIFVPFVRENWIMIGIVDNEIIKFVLTVVMGFLLCALSYLITRFFYRLNRNWCVTLARYVNNNIVNSNTKKHMKTRS